TDFGIAGLTKGQDAGRVTAFGSVLGTIEYMAPEQRKDPTKADHRSDVFSTGMVLYELLTGELPAGTFRPPSQMVPGLSPRWDAVVLKALQPRLEDRFQDMASFAAAVQQTSEESGAPKDERQTSASAFGQRTLTGVDGEARNDARKQSLSLIALILLA